MRDNSKFGQCSESNLKTVPQIFLQAQELQRLSKYLNYDIVGPICESSDTFARNYPLVKSERGDLIVFHSCGAYAESMSSNYNLRDNINSYFSDTI